MSKNAYDKIAAGLDEALAIAKGEAEPARIHSARPLGEPGQPAYKSDICPQKKTPPFA